VISAQSARPDANRSDTLSIDDMRLRLDGTDASFVEITAVRGEVDGSAQVARLLGLARLQTSNGYQMETNGLTAELRSGRIFSDGVLEIRAPFGALTAGQVTFQADSQTSGQQMLFTNGVRLLYKPQP
jgi:lipopolysaccharide export system protein LptC